MNMWHGFRVELIACLFCVNCVFQLHWRSLPPWNGQTTMCDDAQLWWGAIFGITWVFFCLVAEFIKCLGFGNGFCVVLLIWSCGSSFFIDVFDACWGVFLMWILMQAKYTISTRLEVGRIIMFLCCVLLKRWMLLTNGLNYSFDFFVM